MTARAQRAPVVAAVDLGTLPLLTFTRALVFTDKGRSTLNRAIDRGDLAIAGRVGGPRGERVIRREDLIAWMLGDVASATDELTTRRRSAPTKRAPDISNALERIRAAARGGR